MRIWVDADACPNVIKEILFRAAERTRVPLTLVANQPTRIPFSPFVRQLQVSAGFDAADRRILELVEPGDLVITADIPLAAKVIEKSARALNPRGELYTDESVRERLTMRNLMDELRKVVRVVARKRPGAPHEALLVLDGTVGQNAVHQARAFSGAVPLTGVIVTKLDGTAKGGSVVAVELAVSVPIRFLGTGEGLDDLEVFDAGRYARRLVSG